MNDLGNFEPRNVAERTGPGEGGKPHILRDEQQNDASQTLTEFGMNMVCSDEISMSRSIPDTRLPELVLPTFCKFSKHDSWVSVTTPLMVS